MTPDEICARLAAARPARDERNRRILEAYHAMLPPYDRLDLLKPDQDILPEPVMPGQTLHPAFWFAGQLLQEGEPLTAFFVRGKLTWLLTSTETLAL
jgi:hypothetical protein